MRIDVSVCVEDEDTGGNIQVNEVVLEASLLDLREAATKAVDRLLAAAQA